MITPVTAAIIINDAQEILIARRKHQKSNGGLWEFPGGKLEAGESPEACLQREIQEELKLRIKVGKIFHAVTYQYSHLSILLIAYFCELLESLSGDLTDHEQYIWVNAQQLQNYDFSPADIPIVEALINYMDPSS